MMFTTSETEDRRLALEYAVKLSPSYHSSSKMIEEAEAMYRFLRGIPDPAKSVPIEVEFDEPHRERA